MVRAYTSVYGPPADPVNWAYDYCAVVREPVQAVGKRVHVKLEEQPVPVENNVVSTLFIKVPETPLLGTSDGLE
jgi:hypothetical protein